LEQAEQAHSNNIEALSEANKEEMQQKLDEIETLEKENEELSG